MTNIQPKQRYEIGMIDLFFMGRILVLNMKNCGITEQGYNKVQSLQPEPAEHSSRSVTNIFNCIRLLSKPSSLMMIVPSSAPVDSIIKDLSEQFNLDDFSLTEVQLCLRRHNPKKNFKTAATVELQSENILKEFIQ